MGTRHTQPANATALRDVTLSLKAKGVLAVLLSMRHEAPTGYTRCNLQRLEAMSADGRHATRRAVQELEAAGYLQRRQMRDSAGRMYYALYVVGFEQ